MIPKQKGVFMKRLSLICVASAFVALGVAAPSALAVSQSEAGAISNTYAVNHWGVGDVEHCAYSGKIETGKAEWYCYGYFEMWRVNVGPNGEITYAALT